MRSNWATFRPRRSNGLSVDGSTFEGPHRGRPRVGARILSVTSKVATPHRGPFSMIRRARRTSVIESRRDVEDHQHRYGSAISPAAALNSSRVAYSARKYFWITSSMWAACSASRRWRSSPEVQTLPPIRSRSYSPTRAVSRPTDPGRSDQTRLAAACLVGCRRALAAAWTGPAHARLAILSAVDQPRRLAGRNEYRCTCVPGEPMVLSRSLTSLWPRRFRGARGNGRMLASTTATTGCSKDSCPAEAVASHQRGLTSPPSGGRRPRRAWRLRLSHVA